VGHIISKKGIEPDPDTIKHVKDCKPRQTIQQIQAFLGLANYYRKFVRSFADVAAPLTQLLKKTEVFKWGSVQQKAFDTLKERLTTAPILIYPDFSKLMILMTDASNVAIEAVLEQIGPDGKEHPIAYASRGLKPAEKNYATIELECLALVYGTTKFRTYLWGNKIMVYTDHNPLQYLKNHQDTSSRLMRWALKLQEYDIIINYRRGKANGNADALFRPPIAPTEYWPELSVVENVPFEDILTIANELLTSLRTITNYDEFRACMREDVEAQQIIEKAKVGSTPYEI